MKVKQGQQENAISHFKDRSTQDIKGAIAVYLMEPENRPNELIGVAIFKDKSAYRANSSDSVQHEAFSKLRACLVEDPEWTDGEYI